MRAGAGNNRLLPLLSRIEYGAMLIAFVQGVIGPFHEDFRPLNQRRGQETGKSADDDFLEKGGVHPFLTAAMVPGEQKCFNPAQ